MAYNLIVPFVWQHSSSSLTGSQHFDHKTLWFLNFSLHFVSWHDVYAPDGHGLGCRGLLDIDGYTHGFHPNVYGNALQVHRWLVRLVMPIQIDVKLEKSYSYLN